jgi:hypothetical protein
MFSGKAEAEIIHTLTGRAGEKKGIAKRSGQRILSLFSGGHYNNESHEG